MSLPSNLSLSLVVTYPSLRVLYLYLNNVTMAVSTSTSFYLLTTTHIPLPTRYLIFLLSSHNSCSYALWQDPRQQSQIEDIKTKIERNEKIRDKAKELRNVLEDKNAQAQCETQIKESEKYVDYLNSELQLLQEQASAIVDQASNSSGAKVSLSSSNGTSIGESSSLPSDKERRKTKRTSLGNIRSIASSSWG